MGQRRGWGKRSGMALAAGVISACVALVLTGCVSTVSTVEGRAVSMLYDPWRVGGLPVTDGPSGLRDNEPAPTGIVQNTDGGDIDRLALLSINDIGDYWKQNYDGFKGSFTPIDTLISYGSANPSGLTICGVNTYQFANAFYCYGQNMMAWDRGVLLPAGKRHFGDMAITGALAHEYGHAVQDMANMIDGSMTTLVAEQQADCFAGAYLRWVAEGNSARFTLNTTDGLNGILAGLIALRDPLPGPHGEPTLEAGHGTALDRIGAFQMGFDAGTATTCTGIDTADIEHRRAGTPMLLRTEAAGRARADEVVIDKKTLSALMKMLNTSFAPAQPPTLFFEEAPCADADTSPPVSYCPATNAIAVDLPGLQRMGSAQDQTNDNLMLHGENTALSVVMSRYMLALQHERGVELSSAMAGLRTACLTGLGERKMSEPAGSAESRDRKLTVDDLDGAVTGLLTNGLAASGVDGVTAPAGFTRILAFRLGLLGDAEQCYKRFPDR